MGKRPLVSCTLALLGGLFFSEAFFYFPFTLSLGLSLLLLVELAFFRARLLSFSLFLVGLVGFLIHQIIAIPFSERDLRHYIDQGSIRIIARISGPLQHDEKHVRLQMRALALRTEKQQHPIQGDFHLNIWKKEIPFEYGDLLEMKIKLRRPKQFQNKGAFQYADYRERTGWSGVANLSNLDQITKVGEDGNQVIKRIYRWRDEIRRRTLNTFEPTTGAVLMALVIGETGYLPDAVREDFAASGTAHLLAVSGAHLAFVSLFVFGLARFLLLRLPEGILLRLTLWKIPSQWAALLTAIAVILYTLLAGAKMGTLRALTMILVYLLSIWMGRNRDATTALALACLLIIAFEPRAIFEISFQLSFLSVLFIILILEWRRERSDTDDLDPPEKKPCFYQKVFSGASLMMQSTLGATLGTLPLSLYYFHQFSWVGLFSNLIVLPFVGWFIIPMSLLAALSALLFSRGFPFYEVHEQLLSVFLELISFFAKQPGAGFHFASPPLLLIVLYYIVFLAIFILKKRCNTGRLLLGASLCFGFLFFFRGGIRSLPSHTRITFLDVGQGDASVIEFSNGQTMLIDGGSEMAGKFAIAPYLWEHRIGTINILLATHPQFDHMGGLPYLIRTFNIGEIWSNGRQNKADHYQNFLKTLRSKGLNQRIVNNQSPPITIADCKLFFLNPEGDELSGELESNNNSVVLRLSCSSQGKKSMAFLFTGDIEAEAEQRLIQGHTDLKSSVLKVPHHGSQSSSGTAFISAVSPAFAVISAGRKNRYRHPHPDVLQAYEHLGVKIHRSDQDGEVSFELKPQEDSLGLPLKIQTYRSRKIKRISWSARVMNQEWENIKRFFFA